MPSGHFYQNYLSFGFNQPIRSHFFNTQMIMLSFPCKYLLLLWIHSEQVSITQEQNSCFKYWNRFCLTMFGQTSKRGNQVSNARWGKAYQIRGWEGTSQHDATRRGKAKHSPQASTLNIGASNGSYGGEGNYDFLFYSEALCVTIVSSGTQGSAITNKHYLQINNAVSLIAVCNLRGWITDANVTNDESFCKDQLNASAIFYPWLMNLGCGRTLTQH